jgi:predicted CoA-binding protein
VCRELKDKGYRIYPVHPQADAIGGDACYRAFGALPEPAGGVVVAVRPAEAERVVRDAAAAGIRRVWLQQGAESGAAVRFCEEQGMTVVAGQCILLHAEPVRSVHAIHRWFARIFGRLPR